MSRPLPLILLALCAACRADGGGHSAERPNVAVAAPGYRGPLPDAAILTLVSEINNSEISAARGAQPHLQDASAAAFAQQLMTEHIAMNAALDSLRVSRDTAAVPPPQVVTMRVGHNVRAQLIATMPAGPAFDRMWTAMQVGAHAEALDSLRIWQAVAEDEGVKSSLGAAIVRVTSHLDRARALQSALGAGASADTMPRRPVVPVTPDTARKAAPAPRPDTTGAG